MRFNIDKQTNLVVSIYQIGQYLQSIMPKGIRQTETLTICSELINNIYNHAGDGVLTISSEDNDVFITAKDSGNGFKNIDLVIKDGYSTGASLGIGVPSMIRMSDEFEAVSNINGVEIFIKKSIK